MAGALAGLRIVEFAGIGPGPFCAMMLGDHGAEVIRIERSTGGFGPRALARSRRSMVLDLKSPHGVDVARDLCRSADGVIEGFRPGVMERLGLSPEVLIGDNPTLVYGRMTGWGQHGPLADAPGHDINYVAIAGVLEGIGVPGRPPVPPMNYVADYGGGGMMLAFGMLAALLAVQRGGAGQVVDAAMTDGAAMIATMSWGMRAAGLWRDGPGATMLAGAAPFYRSYACSDGKFLCVGAIEPQFWAVLVDGLGLRGDADFASQLDPAGWAVQIARLETIFATRTRDEWVSAFDSTGSCVAPILTMDEAAAHPHNVARGTFVTIGDRIEPAPAPRLSGTPAGAPVPPRTVGEDTDALLAELGYSPQRIATLRAAGAFR